jgi:DNA primase
MRYPPDLLDEIRARIPVSSVVGRRVRLKKRGREHVGLSPFNAEKSPSFTVNDQKRFYHCFSSGKHGDIFTFLMETEGLSFPEAVERLAQEAGVSLPKPGPQAEKQSRERQSLYEVLEEATAFFMERLKAREGARARAYLGERGLSEATQRVFALGYAPESRHALREHLAGRGVTREAMAAAGLVIEGEGVAVAYDRFRDRVIFPIRDVRGRVIAFGGRALSPDVPAKYLNSPETPLFHKGATLYNIHSARKAAHEGAALVAVEGYMDAIALASNGFPGAVAPLGTALTDEQMALMWRYADEPVLCFDGDSAGLKAAFRAIDVALPALSPGKSLRFALLPEGLDPDDLIRARGRDAFAEVVAAARPLVDMLWTREAESTDRSTPERRAQFEARIRATADLIRDDAVRRHYHDALRERLREEARASRGGFRPKGSPARVGAPGSAPASGTVASRRVRPRATPFSEREAVLLLTAMRHPELLETHVEEFCALDFSDSRAAALRDALVDAALGAPSAVEEAVRARGQGPLLDALTHPGALAMYQAKYWHLDPATAREDAEVVWVQLVTLHQREGILHKELREAERALGDEPSEENFARLMDIKAQLQAVTGVEALVDGFGERSGRGHRAL